MPRPKKWPPSILVHKPSGRARIRVAGVDYYLGIAGSEEARREYARLVAELAENGGPPPSRRKGWPTLYELADAWLSERGPACSPKECGLYKRALKVLIQRGRGDLRSDQFGVRELADVRAEMLKLKRTWRLPNGQQGEKPGGGWCVNVVNHFVIRIRTIWRWAEERGLAPPGSWAHLRALKPIPAHDRSVRKTPKQRPAETADVEAVLACMHPLRLRAARAMLRLQWLTGMRSGEARLMRAGEVDRSGEVWLYRPATHKNAWRGHDRVIPIGPQAREVLAPLLEGKAPEEHVFTTRTGKPYAADEYGRVVARAAKKAGRPWFRAYAARHGYRMRVSREMGMEAARAGMGHASIEMTAKYGDSIDLKLATDVARKCG